MKYTCTVLIKKPIQEVVDLWSDESYFNQWQDGFKSSTLLSGIANTEGAKSKLILNDKRYIELIETIITSNLPHEKTALYEHSHMTNTQSSKFKAIDEHTTEYTSEVEYIKFNGLFITLIAKLFPKKFKAQSQKWMDQFKTFSESK